MRGTASCGGWRSTCASGSNNTMRLAAFILSLATTPALAQSVADTTAHRIPFGAAGNAVELTVGNPERARFSEATVALVAAPAWLRFEAETVPLGAFVAEAEPAVSFRFDVAPEAPVGAPADVTFEVRAGGAVVGTRSFRVVVEPPREVALTGPWPNPVRSSGRLAVELPAGGRTRVVLYDVLGREVARLIDAERAAGRHEVTLDASALAAGVYVVRVEAADAVGRPVARTRRLTVVR